MAELESVLEQKLIDQLCQGESQWTYRPDIRTEEELWDNFRYILEQNNKAKLNDGRLTDSEFAKIKNDLSHASFYDAGKWLVGENGQVYVHVQRGNETLHDAGHCAAFRLGPRGDVAGEFAVQGPSLAATTVQAAIWV